MRRFSFQIRLALTALLLVIAVIAVLLLLQQSPASSSDPALTPGQMMTLDPLIISNLTSIPQSSPLAGQAANDIVALGEMVEACDAYTAERRDQMETQIALVIDPRALTSDIIIMLGPNPHGRLLSALGNVTGIQWRLDGQPADSCLIPIGKRLNELIVAAGETPVAIFEENS